MRAIMKQASLLALLVSMPITATAQADAVAVAVAVDSFVEAEMERLALPGISIAVIRDGTVVKARGFGLANVELKVPATAETIYQSGSVGKQFTAAAVMLLVEDGKLGLDEPVRKYLPALPEQWRDITIRHLLTHTAGTSGYPKDFDFRRDYSEDELLSRLAEVPLGFSPGQEWQYSNVGYVVLGALVGKITGKFYGEFLQERIFRPTGMSTARIISQADIVPDRASGYQLKDGKLKNQDWVSPTLNTTADGSIYLTVLDLAKWDSALYSEKLLKATSLEQMWAPVKLNSGDTRPYGFGWHISAVNKHKLVDHSGHWQGFSTHVARFPDDRLTVVVLANLANANATGIARGIAALYEKDLAATVHTEVPADCAALDSYVGRYELTPAIVLSITTEGCRLWAQGTGQDASQLFPESATKYFVKDFDAQVTFVQDAAGKVVKLVLHQGGDHVARRLE